MTTQKQQDDFNAPIWVLVWPGGMWPDGESGTYAEIEKAQELAIKNYPNETFSIVTRSGAVQPTTSHD